MMKNAALAAEKPPIVGMTEKEIFIEFQNRFEKIPFNCQPLWSTDTAKFCAHITHSLAQPAPVVDQDTGAKAVFKIMTPDRQWGDVTENWRARCRAVAAMKESGK